MNFERKRKNYYEEGEIKITPQEKELLNQAGLSEESYKSAKSPDPGGVPTAGIVDFLFNKGWFTKYDPCAKEHKLDGRRDETGW